MWKPVLRASLLAALPAVGWAAPPPQATATIVEGDAQVIRDASVFALTEGVRLRKDDILHTDAKGRFVRLEFADGTAVDVAPGSKLMVSPKLGKATPPLYLLEGAVKLTMPATPPSGTLLVSPSLELTDVAKGVVLNTSSAQTAVFAESGASTLVEREGGKAAATQALRAGQFYQRAGDGKAQVAARPTGAFIQGLPKAFLDTLPRRIELFKARDVSPRLIGDPSYETLQPWIDAEPGLRAGFVPRWRSLAKGPDFRAGLVAGIAAHPEWDRTLFPEKYRPKPRVGDTPAPSR